MAKVGRPRGAYTQYRRLSQLREMLEMHPKGVSIFEIARRLHVTDRSVRRYLRELEREVDVERHPDPDGFGGVVVKIPTRDLPRRAKLHRTQIYGLLMARRVFRILEGTTFEKTLGEAVDHLLSLVQRSPRRGATMDPDTRLEDRFLYLPGNPGRSLRDDADAAEVVDTLIDACAQLRECTIGYRKSARAKPEALTIHPYAIVVYKDVLYTVCFVKERGAVRTLRLDRIVDADASPLVHFDVPVDFSVDAYFAGQFGVHSGGDKEHVVVDFDPSVADWVSTRRYPGERGDGAVESLPNGGVRVKMFVALDPEVRAWVLSFGDKAKVVAPAALIEQVTADLKGALEKYR